MRRCQQHHAGFEGRQLGKQLGVIFPEAGKTRGAVERFIRAVADEQHGRLVIVHFLEQAGKSFGILKAAGSRNAAHRIARPAEVAKDQRTFRPAPAQTRFQVTVAAFLFDQPVAEQDDSIAVAQLERR